MNITVQIDEISLSTIVADVVSYDDEGDTVTEGQATVADKVAEIIAKNVMRSPEYTALKERVAEIRKEVIREEIRPLIQEALSKPIQKTNTWGNPVGEPVALPELIIDEARKALTEPKDSYRSKEPYVSEVVRLAVRAMFDKELKEQVDQARVKLQKELEAQMYVRLVQPAVVEAVKKTQQ